MNQEKIGKFIAECRKNKNLTQAQLAEKLNMSNKSISKWETGKGMPDSSVMLELCNYLDISVNELLSGEYLNEDKYKEKATENIISIAKESDKNKKIKNCMVIIVIVISICLLVLLIGKIIYKNFELNIEYDDRLIKCEIRDDDIICTFNGLSLVCLETQKVDVEEETLIFIKGTMLLQNKIRSHFESWDSMAQLIDNQHLHFKSEITLDKKDCKEKIKVYYTDISFKKIKKASKFELQRILDHSKLIAEN